MNTVSHPEIIGLDVSRDWLDIHCLSDDRRIRLPNTDEGHSELEAVVGDREALVCFEATGGHEWRLWASMAAAGIEARQLAPAQVKAFGRSRGTLAKTDRVDAELIARFMAFRPEAGRRPPTAGSVGSVVNPAPERENRTQSEQGLSTAFHALRAAENPKRTFTNKPPTSGSVGRMWSIQAPNAKPRNGANKDCPQAFHALRAAANEKRANDPKRQKSGTMSGFIIGSGRIGPGAAPKRQNPHEPPTTRSRRDSTRILTSARYSCLVSHNCNLANT